MRAAAFSAAAAAMTFCVMVFGAGDAIAAEIKLLASANASLRSALTELAPQFERATGHKVTMDFASVLPMKQRVDAGETFDIVIAPGLVDDLLRQGKVAADTRVTVARTGLGVVAPKGTARPDVSSADVFKRILLNAKSIGYQPDSEPGILFLQVLDQAGLAQQLGPRLKAYPSLDALAAALDKRDLDFVVSSITNLAAVFDTVDALPPEMQRRWDFQAAVSTTTKEPDAAKALVQFLSSPTAASVFKAKGFELE